MKRVLIAAISLDGFIAQERNQASTTWTSQADKKWFSLISREVGTVIMGSTTFNTIGRPLSGRKTIIYTSHQEKYPEAEAIENFNLESAQAVYTTGRMTITKLMQVLAELGAKKVAICGGAEVYREAWKENQIDELYLTVEPVFFGAGIKLLPEEIAMERLEVIERVNLSPQTTMFHLAVKKVGRN